MDQVVSLRWNQGSGLNPNKDCTQRREPNGCHENSTDHQGPIEIRSFVGTLRPKTSEHALAPVHNVRRLSL